MAYTHTRCETLECCARVGFCVYLLKYWDQCNDQVNTYAAAVAAEKKEKKNVCVPVYKEWKLLIIRREEKKCLCVCV